MPYEFVETGYGKNWVRLLHVKRHSAVHVVNEWQVCTELCLATRADYTHGDNSAIVATDSQKNTVYLLARSQGLSTPEAFGTLLCRHFLSQYSHVTRVSVTIDVHPWRRLKVNGEDHDHAFVTCREAIRFCHVQQNRTSMPDVAESSMCSEPSASLLSSPTVCSGISGLQLLKTTQSSFRDFLTDEFRSLSDTDDRVFSTVVQAKWTYHRTVDSVDFDAAWELVRQIIIDQFAGPARGGVFSSSVQKTLHDTQVEILARVHSVEQVEIVMPNKHYFNIDLSKFPSVGCSNNQEVFLPVDQPSGNIKAVLKRSEKSKI